MVFRGLGCGLKKSFGSFGGIKRNSAPAHEFRNPLTNECRNGEDAIPSQRYLKRGQREQNTLLRRWGAVTSQ